MASKYVLKQFSIRIHGSLHVIHQKRERVFHQDIQTPRSGLKKGGVAELF